ncbi:S41 family peptidase [uncultured Microbulbifer sp.]|uniref:S41 family peptidase n=1 Tax=uncultured Microbulbifer sp. TaxID=348147 RepID=UPI00261C5C77|nr:S41 family peptidase [uncultured Microbulbifer sp.]
MKQHLVTLLLLIPTFGFTATFSAEQKNILISAIDKEISSRYVLLENIPAIRESLQQASQSDAMREANTPQAIAELLTTVLEPHDKHFGVRWHDPKSSQARPSPEGWFTKLGRKNSGFTRVSVLEGNIGYIDFWGFDHVNEKSQKRVEAAMTLIEDTDAIIFDLINNGGGDGNMGQLISSYLFDKPTHLNSIYWKFTDDTTEFWTLEQINGKKKPNTPVYILTSADTFSAAESFAYYLKHLKRATIVGETTKGGAHPIQFLNIDMGFKISIPIAKAVNPITKGNWEGVGVLPDIKVPRRDALNTAYQLSLEQLKKSTQNLEQLKEIHEKLRQLTEKHSHLNNNQTLHLQKK